MAATAAVLLSMASAVQGEPQRPTDGLNWSLTARGIETAGLRAAALEASVEDGGGATIRVLGLELPGLGPWGDLRVSCDQAQDRCARGTLQRLAPGDGSGAPTTDRESELAAATFERTSTRVRLVRGGGSIALALDRGPSIQFDEWAIAPWLRRSDLPIDVQGGLLNGVIASEADAIRFESELRGLDFDTADGRYAGGGIDLAIHGRWSSNELDGQLTWRGGEALLDAIYLPPPPSEIGVGYRFDFSGPEPRAWLDLAAETWLDASLQARLDPSVDLSNGGIADAVAEASLRVETLDLARAWPLGPESLAARAGWPDLAVGGRVSGGVDWYFDRAPKIELAWRAVNVEDPAGRVRVRGLEGRLEVGAENERLEAGFDAATLYRLPLDASRWVLAGRDGRIGLQEPLRIPLLDGAIRIDRLTIDRGESGPPSIDLDAAIEPLDLARLTGTLGLPRFGGSLSGRVPGVRLDGETLRVAGGLDLELFSGQARITGLSIERPFGTLPALSGSLEFQRLDLAPLTSAFEFGAMQGELSGYVTGLRLLDWQPVAFDAWLATERDTRKPRRISQRAVDQIARLGGGGAAALSAPILRLFDEFAYTRIGLGCRLAANVCTMRGVREIEGGGYMIVDGRGIPRLNVVGFRREVDWPVLLAQLKAATQGEGVRVGD